ncbi:chloride channel [Chytridium lagenaria]|nr:chloride channel [Chytridium lagenaria]
MSYRPIDDLLGLDHGLDGDDEDATRFLRQGSGLMSNAGAGDAGWNDLLEPLNEPHPSPVQASKKRITTPHRRRASQFLRTIASRFYPSSPTSATSPTSPDDDHRIPGLYYGPTRPLRAGPPTSLRRGTSFPDWVGFSGRRVAYDNFTTIDWIHDLTMERMRLVGLRAVEGWEGRVARMFDAAQAWIVVFFVGILTGWIAGYIDIGSGWLSDIKEGYCSAGFYLNRKFCCWHRPENAFCSEWITWSTAFGVKDRAIAWTLSCMMYSFFAVLFATTASMLVKAYAPYAAGEGVPEIKTILGGFVIRKFLGGWTLLIKIVGLVLSVGSGLSLGKEGPLVHISCCLGNILPRMFKKYASNEAKKREILSASSAAGVSVAFGAPIGGVLFSLEVFSYYFPYKTMWRSFFCAMVGAIALRLLDPFRTGKLVWFQVKYSRDWHAFELPLFVFLGALGGLAGTLFIRMNLFIASVRKNTWLKERPVMEVAVIALITGIVGYSHVYLRVSTVDLWRICLESGEEKTGDFYGLCKKEDAGYIALLLLMAAVIKFMLTVFTLPTIAIGACVGRAFGILMQMFQDAYPKHPIFSACNPNHPQCITPDPTRWSGLPHFLSLTVIMFELTGAVSYVLPIIITILTAKWVGDVGGKGLYYLLISEEYRGSAVVEDIMTKATQLEVVTETGVECGLLHNTKFKGFPIINSRMKLIAYAGRAELRFAIVTPSTLFKKMGSRYVLVTDRGVLKGIITKKDLLRHVMLVKTSSSAAQMTIPFSVPPTKVPLGSMFN